MPITNDPYLEKCRQLVEDALGWGSSAGWTNEDFENLSDKIFDKTQVRLSVSTLKRIWGKVKYDSYPTASTLNALARFLDYDGWREFQHKHAPAEVEVAKPAEQPVAAVITNTPEEMPLPAPKRKKTYLPVAALCVLAVVALALISFLGKRNTPRPLSPAMAKFQSRLTSDELPNSVVFDYDASAFNSDSVYLQQSWDMSRRQKIPPNGRQVTSIYYYPGHFMAKLVVDGQIKKQTPVFIKTKGWKGIIKQTPSPVYLNANEIKLPGAMGITAATLKEKIGTPVFNHTWTEFANVREFDSVNATNFTFEGTVRNTSTVEQCLCRKILVTVLGTESAIIIPLCDKGCIADINLLTGYHGISGRDTDLSAFGCDVKSFHHVVIAVANKRLKIYLDKAMIFDAEEPMSIGKVVGLRFEFEGAGEIKDAKLSSNNKVALQEKF